MNSIKIEIGGKKRGFIFGLRFIRDICEHYDTDWAGVGGILGKNPFDLIPTAMYYGALSADRGEEIDYTKDDFIDWIDQLEGGFKSPKIEQVHILFIQCLTDHVEGLEELLVENGYDAKEAKKKLIGIETL